MRFLWRRPFQVAGILVVFVPAMFMLLCWEMAPKDPISTVPNDPTRQSLRTATAPADSSKRNGPMEDPTLPIRREALDASARAEGQEALRRMRLHWRLEYEAEKRAQAEGRLGCGFMPPGRFVRMARFEQPEIDLFSRGYPELAEAWAKAATESQETPVWERSAAVTCLGALWHGGWK